MFNIQTGKVYKLCTFSLRMLYAYWLFLEYIDSYVLPNFHDINQGANHFALHKHWGWFISYSFYDIASTARQKTGTWISISYSTFSIAYTNAKK